MLGLASSLWHVLGFEVHSFPLRKLHVWHHEVDSCWWRSLELIRRRSSSCPTFWFFAKVLDISHMNNTQCQFPNLGNLFLGRGFEKLEGLGIGHVGDQLLRLFAELINLLLLDSSPAGKTPCLGDSRTAESTFSPFVCDRVLLLHCGMRYAWYYFSQRCRYKFPRHCCPMRFGGLRIFLLLDQVDPVVHFANSASV